MSQISYGTITITDVTDIDNIQNYYLATSASSGVTTSTSGWTTAVQSMDSTKQYLWNYEQILGTGGVVINTTTPVIIGRYGQNGQNGQPGVSITSIDEYYKANNSSTNAPTSWNAVNVIDKPTASNKYLWNYQVIHYSNNTSEGSAAEARIIGVYGDKGDKGEDGISPTVSKTGNIVTITDAAGNTVTVSDGTNGTSYYTHIRYATSNTGANMTATPTASTTYIGVYSGTSSSAPTTANSYTWSKYMGTDGISVTKVTPIYYLKTSSDSVPTAPSAGTAITSTSTGSGAWTTAIPTYVNGGTYYTSTQTYLSGGTSPVSSTAVVDQALTTANSNAYGAYNVATGINQHFWTIESDYATGIPAGSYITDSAINTYKSNKTGGNLLTRADGIWIRNGVQTLASLTGTALQFYNPSDSNHPLQLSIGANGTLQSGNYDRGSDSKFSSNGTKIDLTNGDIITKYFRVSQGLEPGINVGAYIYGTIEALNGKIGAGSTNYWEIGEYTDYNLTTNATIIGHGGSFIQLGDSSTWRLATNRIHTGWYTTGDTVLHYPTVNSKYWDFGVHVPYSDTPSGRGNDKFIYIRTQKDTNNSLENLLYDLDDNYDSQQWEYKFWVDSSGNVHAPGFYVGNSTTPIGGGANTIAQKIINSDGTTFGKGSTTKPIYIDSNGYVQEINYTIQTSVPSGAVFTDHITTATTTGNGNAVTSITADANGALTVTKGTTFSTTDKNVQSAEANTTKIWLVGTPTSGTSTGTLNYDSSVYITNTAGTLHATTFEGNLTGTASRATADSDGNTIKSTYLKLSGGNVTGAVTFGSSVSVDELTAGDLVVNGNASFTNNAQFNTINGVAVGSNPKFTDNNTTYTFANGTNGFTVTPSGGTAQTVTVTPSITNNVTGSGTSGYLAKFTGGNTIGNGPALGTDTTKFLNNKGEWAVPAGTYTYTLPLAASGVRGGVQIGYTQSGKNYPVQLSSEKMYVNVPWENTWTAMTGATSSADGAVGYIGTTPPKSGYNTKYWRADGTWSVPPNDNTHRPIQLDSTEILGNNTTALNLVTGGGMALSNSSGSVTIAHKDTSSQATSTNSGRTYIQSITLDTYGHVTGLSTATESVTDTHYTTHLYAGKSDGNVNAATTNGNTYLMVLDNTTVRDRRKISGSGAASVTSDANGNITINSPIAITGVSFADGTITFTKSDGNTIPITTDNFVITQASGATALVRLKADSTTEYEGYSAGGATTAPVYFDSNGHPAAVTSIPWSLIANKPSSYTPSSHTHGNITNGGDITTTATIASGDRLVINDESESKINNSSITFGTNTTTFLSNKGTWETPSAAGSATNATNDSDGNPINTTYLKKSGGTMTGAFNTANNTWNKIGDDAQIGDINEAGTLGIQGINGNTAIRFTTYNQTSKTTGGKISWDGTKFTITGTVDTSISGNAATATTATTASSATEFSSNATVTLTGDTTGTSAGSKKSWSVATTNSYITSLGRAASADYLTPSYLSKVHFCLASSSMTTHKPPAGDGYITTYHWDNSGWAAQFYLRHSKDDPSPMVRGATTTDGTSDWGEWKYILTEVNYNTYAPKKDGTGASGSWGINITGSAGSVAWSGITSNPITFSSTAYGTTGWSQLGGRTNPLSSIRVWKPTDTVAWGTVAHSAVIAFGCGDTKGMLDCSYSSPVVSIAGGNVGGSTDAAPKWYFKFSATSGSTYTLPAASKTLAASDGSNASGNWGISITGNAANVTGTVAIANGGTGLTASPSMLTNLGSTTAANVLQASPRPGVTGTLGAANGGTGQTSLINAANSLLNALSTGSSTPVDNDYYISQYVNGGTTTTTYHRRPMSALWSYISGKISSSGTYVTIGTDQTITANQKTFNGAIRWGTASKYGAAHYDSTLEAIVFSFA